MKVMPRFVTSDGQVFNSDIAAQDHENDLANKKREDACAFFRRDMPAEKLEVMVGRKFPSSHNAGLKVSVFCIRNEEELKLFCEGYASWDRDLCNFERAKKLPYPQEYFLFSGEFGYFFLNREEMDTALKVIKNIQKTWEE